MFKIETSIENKGYFEELLKEYPDNVIAMEKNHFMGSKESLEIFIQLSPLVIAGVCQVITAMINAKKEFKFKQGKTEISFKGFSEKKILSLLNQLNKEEKTTDTEES